MARMNKLAVCLVCFTLAACSSTETPAPSSAPDTASATAARDPARGGVRPGRWLRADSQRQGVPITWEFRDDVEPARRATLPRLVVVSVLNHTQTGTDQRPQASLVDTYDAIERELLAQLSGKAELVAVLTYYYQYDWYFYTASDSDVGAIKALFAKAGQRDVTVNVENDPQGEFYTTLIDRVRAR